MSLELVTKQLEGIATDAKAAKEAGEKLPAIENSIAEIDGKVKGLEGVPEELKKVNERLDSQEAEIKKGLVVDNKGKLKSFAHQVAENMASKAADIIKLKDSKSAPRIQFDIDIKAAGTMTIASNYTGTLGLTDYTPDFARVQRRRPFLRELVTVRATDKMYVGWAEQANPDPGAAGMTSEGTKKTQTDFDVVERTKKVEKITAFIKVSREMLDDVDFILSEIETELVELINLKLDEQLLSGDDIAPNLKGILEYAPDFDVSGTDLAGGIPDANNFDVLRAAAWQIENSHFIPNYAVLNPADAAMMDLSKGNDGHYVMPPFSTASGQIVAGLVVVKNSGVAAGTFLVGDFSKSILAVRKNMTIDMGYENDDFTKNLVTILAEMRAAHYIKSNHVNAFVQGDFTSAKAALLADIDEEA